MKSILFTFSNKPVKGVIPAVLSREKINQILVSAKGEKRLALGIGNTKDLTRRQLFLLPRKLIAFAKANKVKRFSIDFNELTFKHLKLKTEEIAEIVATNFEMANFEFVQFKTKPKEGWDFIEEVVIRNANEKVKQGFNRGAIIGEEINACRTLCNTPGGLMTPELLAESAVAVAKRNKIRSKVLDVDDMKILKMGGVLGVGQGSQSPPCFIVMEYYGAKNKKEAPIVLAGKGITFDTGGINLKPSQGGSLTEMQMDMSGGAAVIHTLAIAARLGLKKNLVGLIPAAENMPSGSSYRPGDILYTMSGKTIEVLNTDAEGRVVLADALTYAQKYQPKLVIDIATLTGAAMVALGQRASAIFTKDEKLEGRSRDAGEMSGDYVWPLPLWDEHEEEIKGIFGDVANIKTKGDPRAGGAIDAAAFLYQFAKGHPWMHMDIAPTMTTIEGQYLSRGASGSPIRMLITLLQGL